MNELLTAINTGGDVAMIATAAWVMRLDRRVVRLETVLKMILGDKLDGNKAEIG